MLSERERGEGDLAGEEIASMHVHKVKQDQSPAHSNTKIPPQRACSEVHIS